MRCSLKPSTRLRERTRAFPNIMACRIADVSLSLFKTDPAFPLMR
jgi:hypothetical protein